MKVKTRKIVRYLMAAGLILGALAFIVLVSNFNYFWAQIKYRTSSEPAQVITEEQVAELNEPNTLTIPSLEISAPIRFVTEAKESVFQEALQDGIVHYPGTAKVGQVGNSYIFGHSSDFALSKGDYKTVFALLPNIELGAQIWASDESGNQFQYIVTEKFVAKKTDTHLLNQDTEQKSILTLQTSYPIGTALQRYIVKAELYKENPYN